MNQTAEDLLETTGRELSAVQLRDLRSSIRSVFFAAAALSGIVTVSPTAHADSGGWCTDVGCYVWADPYFDMGAGGGGSGTTNPGCTEDCAPPPGPPPPQAIPPSQLPNFPKLHCAVTYYGELPQHYGTVPQNLYAFRNSSTGMWVFSQDTSVPPAGFRATYGETDIGPDWYGGGQTIIYAGGMVPHPGDFRYIDPNTQLADIAEGPFTAFEWALITYGHELGHQNGLGSSQTDEYLADGYGYKALQAYRADHGIHCP